MMQNGLDLDLLDDSDFYKMHQLSTLCETELYNLFSVPPLFPERFQRPNLPTYVMIFGHFLWLRFPTYGTSL